MESEIPMKSKIGPNGLGLNVCVVPSTSQSQNLQKETETDPGSHKKD